MGFFRLVLVAVLTLPSFADAQTIAQSVQPAPEETSGPKVQELDSDSPQWVAREYLESVRERGFSAAADFMHPDEMDRFKSMLIPVFLAESEAGGRALMNATFGRDARMADVRLADPADFLRRFARVMSARIPDRPTDYDRQWVLGAVEEGERTHVLVRLSSDVGIGERLEVVSLLPFEGDWKLILAPKLEAAIRALAQRGQDQHNGPRLVPRLRPHRPELQP